MTAREHQWSLVPLSTVAEFRNGINFSKANFGTGIKVIGVSNFQNNVRATFDGLGQINPQGVVRKEHLLKNGDVLFVRSNGNRALIGRSMYVEGLDEDVTHSSFSIRLRFTSDACHPRFYAYLFRSHVIRQTLSLHGGGTNISNLNQDILGRMEVPLPPKPVQCKIASILSAYDDLIENNTRRIKILEEIASRAYREWFVNFRFPGHQKAQMVQSDVGPIPQGWTIRSLFDVAEVTYGFPFKSKLFAEKAVGKPVIRIRDIRGSSTETSTSEVTDERYIVNNGDLLVGMDGDFHMGKWTGGEAYLNQRVVRFRPKGGLPPYILFLALQRPIAHFDSTIMGTTVAHLSDRDLRSISVVIPDDKTLEQMKSLMNASFSIEISLALSNANLRKTRDLLLPKLISGEINVQHCETEAVAQTV